MHYGVYYKVFLGHDDEITNDIEDGWPEKVHCCILVLKEELCIWNLKAD